MLRYTGGGCGGSLAGIPARDLTDQEVEVLGGEKTLIDTGLYTKAELHPRKKAAETIEENAGTEQE